MNERKPIGPIGKTQQEMIEEIYIRVMGDGSDGQPGLFIDVDRLKREMGFAKWVIGGAVMCLIGFLVELFTGMFSGRR